MTVRIREHSTAIYSRFSAATMFECVQAGGRLRQCSQRRDRLDGHRAVQVGSQTE